MVALSVVRAANDKARIDSRYFGRRALSLDARIRTRSYSPLGNLCASFRKGIFDIKADTYVEESGVPFVRVGDLRRGLIDFDSVAQITPEAHRKEAKTALREGDLALSKTAYPAAALVTVDQCNCSQDTIAARLSSDGRDRFRPGYILSFLNSTIGRTLYAREFQGNVQEHLGLTDAAKLPIPLFGQALHDSVHALVISAHTAAWSAKAALAEAEATLLDALGLRDWSPPEPLTYIRSAAAVTEAGRLDAGHHAPAWPALRQEISANARLIRLGEVCSANRRGVQPTYFAEGDLRVVASQHIDPAGIDLDSLPLTEKSSLTNRDLDRALILPGDVLIYTTGAYVGRTAPYLSNTPALASNHVNIVRQKDIDPCVLSMILNSRIGAAQTQTHVRGTAQAELYSFDIGKFEVPVMDLGVSRDVRAHVDRSRALLGRKSGCLAAAKHAVEIAIEESEAAALAFIAEQEAA